MGLSDKLRKLKNTKTNANNCSPKLNCSDNIELRKRNCNQNITVITPDHVTEQTLQVWRTLPSQIRHDPSMASFQMENERLHGSSVPTDNNESITADNSDDNTSNNGLNFIDINSSTKLNNHRPINNHNHIIKQFTHNGANETCATNKDDCFPRQCHDDDFRHFKSNNNDNNDDHDHDHDHNDDDDDGGNKDNYKRIIMKMKRERIKLIKRVALIIFWLFIAVVFIIFEEKHLLEKTLAIPKHMGKDFMLVEKPTGDFKLKVFGAFNETTTKSFNSLISIESFYHNNYTDNLLTVQPQLLIYNALNKTWIHQDILQAWHLPLVNEELLDQGAIIGRNYTYHVTPEVLMELEPEGRIFQLRIFTNLQNEDMAIKLIYNPLIINVKTGTFLAAFILMIFYALLVWEIFERTFVAIICSMLSIAVLACFNDRPNMEEIVEWMDMEMLTLLFCMMIIVGILTETGIFDYIAVVAFEVSGGKIWPMIYSLCFITCLVSSFLDNMSTVLLMTPVAIRLCEVMSLDPVPVLMGIIVHANIGGSLTPIGDPISIIIYSNHFIASNGVTFMKFVEHTIPGVLLTILQSCIYMRLIFMDIESLRLNEPKEIKELRREIRVWHKAANSISSFSKDADLVRETLQKKVRILKHTLKRKLRGLDNIEEYVHTLEELKLKYPIKKKLLLLQACGALMFVIISFFIQSVPQWRTLPLGWVALLGVIALLIILNRDDMDHLMHRIEWTTLLFFAAMFVMMECVERLGLFSWIGKITEHIILCVNEQHRLAMAIFIILWMSALASAILDSIPVTAMMVKVVVSLVSKESLGIPLEPLVWALAFGPCLGGNGTLYGASANVISAGIAEQHGYKISFTRYLRIVFPMMLGQIAIINAYLFVAHILFNWH